MEARQVRRHPKAFARVLFIGLFVAVFLYLVLLLVLPFLIGPWALTMAFAIALPFAVHLHHRHRVSGVALTLFLLAALLLTLPVVLWPPALLAELAVGGYYLASVRAASHGPKHAPLYRPLPQRSPSGTRRMDAVELAVTPMFLVAVFAVALFVVGEFVYATSLQSPDAMSGFVALAGGAFILCALSIYAGLYDQARWPMNLNYFSNADTTDDH